MIWQITDIPIAYVNSSQELGQLVRNKKQTRASLYWLVSVLDADKILLAPVCLKLLSRPELA